MFTQVGVKQLTDFSHRVTAASDLVDCTLVNCDVEICKVALVCEYQFLGFFKSEQIVSGALEFSFVSNPYPLC